MAELLTTKELQAILQVDRTTIYRMADSGRLPAIKVGSQWRFPRGQVEAWLHQQSTTIPLSSAQSKASAQADLTRLFPVECVQLIQDSFADALGVMILVTDLEGNLITEPSNACGLFVVAESSPTAHKRCLDLWANLARQPSLAPRFLPSHLGLMCARGLIRVGSEIKAMLVLGGIAPAPWPPSVADVQRIAADLGLEPDLIWKHIEEVHHLDAAGQVRVLPYVQRIADIFAHIANERNELFGRLQRIAEITDLLS